MVGVDVGDVGDVGDVRLVNSIVVDVCSRLVDEKRHVVMVRDGVIVRRLPSIECRIYYLQWNLSIP